MKRQRFAGGSNAPQRAGNRPPTISELPSVPLPAFPVVCIGMSSGALGPLKTILKSLSPNTGMAFVLIHHLRHRPSLMPEILPRYTSMPVEVASDGQTVRPNHVYVIPSGQDLTLKNGYFGLRPSSKPEGWPIVMTLFLNSLSVSRHPGIAVVLSGSDKNGVGAFKAFKEHGGILIVQQPESAVHPEMPAAAIATVSPDYVLSPDEIARAIEASALRLQPSGC